MRVYVDETRPRNQGAYLAAWEMAGDGVPHTLTVDKAGGHLMQHGDVDMVIVGTDRTTANGDVCNKIGTYLKALAAKDNGVPFYVALPSPTIDWTVRDELKEIPIEERPADEVTLGGAARRTGRSRRCVSPDATSAANHAFDVTQRGSSPASSPSAGCAKPRPRGSPPCFPSVPPCHHRGLLTVREPKAQ